MNYNSENLKVFSPHSVFCKQRSRAKSRKIDWQLTFDQWMDIWDNSGQWENMGKGVGLFMMCRVKEPGPYSIENVYIGTGKQNQADRLRKLYSRFTIKQQSDIR